MRGGLGLRRMPERRTTSLALHPFSGEQIGVWSWCEEYDVSYNFLVGMSEKLGISLVYFSKTILICV